jgi:hypothetical protein
MRNRAAIATAAADLVTAAADTDGGTELRRAADEFSRAARAQWGRVPGRTPGGKMLRTAAYLLAACRRRSDTAIRGVRRTLLHALAKLADALATLRFRQQRILQAAAAREAAAGLAACASPVRESPSSSRGPSSPVDVAFLVSAESTAPAQSVRVAGDEARESAGPELAATARPKREARTLKSHRRRTISNARSPSC